VARLERLFAERLERLRTLPAVRSVRRIGAVAALDLAPRSGGGYLDELGPFLGAELLARGILLRPLGNVLYFMPPYAITDGEAHGVFDAIEDVVGRL
jgi:adenosylmethionine-8-amino-7-oxononanoate aminotransferase